MTTNIERAAEVLRDDKHYKMGPHGEQFLTSEAARSLADAGLLTSDEDDLIAEKQAHAELRAWVESLHPRVDSAGGGSAVTFRKAIFLDEITRILEATDG